MPDDWKARFLHGSGGEMRRGTATLRTEMALRFRQMIQSVIEPGFREIAEQAAAEGVPCNVECELGGVHPRAMFCIRPSGRSIRFQLDGDGRAVREIEGVYLRPLGQRMCWTSLTELERQLTRGYARLAAAGIVQDHFRTTDAGL